MYSHDLKSLAYKLEDVRFEPCTIERIALRKHLLLIAEALRAVHKTDDDGSSIEHEIEVIRKCLGDAVILDAAIDVAHEASKVLRNELERACSGRVITNDRN